MKSAEIIFFWLAIAGYVGATVSYAIAVSFKRDKFVKFGVISTFTGFIFHSSTLALRWLRLGHGPYLNKYEVWVSDAWMIVAIFLIAQLIYPRIKPAGMLVAPVSLLLVGGAITLSQANNYLPPTYESLWLVVHITFAKLAFGSFVLASALAAIYLLKKREETLAMTDSCHRERSVAISLWPKCMRLPRRASALLAMTKKDTSDVSSLPRNDKTSSFYDRLPSIEVIDDLIYRFTLFGFFMLAVMIVAGALWANKSWGRYWGWDPVETWSLLVWIVYGIYLHLRRTLRWGGKRAAVFSLAAVSFVLISYFVVPYLPGTIHDIWVGR